MPAMLKPHEREDRAARLAPLFAWMEARGIFGSRVVRVAFARRGRSITRSHANQIKAGLAPAPDWLIEECCAVLCVPVSLIYPATGKVAEPSGNARSPRRHVGHTGHAGHVGQQAAGSSEWSVA